MTDAAASTRWSRRWALPGYPVWAAATVAAGVAVRIHHWLGSGSLNSDELWIVLNLRDRSFLGLREPLEYDQLAPLGWLWLEKLHLLLGHGDTLLRLPSLLAGCAAVALTALLARRLLPAPAALAAVILVAGAPVMIYQSSQVKQYSFEAAACALLLTLALRTLDTERDTTRHRTAIAFWLAGGTAVWVATTATFVVAAVGAVLVALAALNRQWTLLRLHALAALPAAASILTAYALAPPPQSWLYDWWTANYAGSLGPADPTLGNVATWSAKAGNIFAYTSLHIQPVPARIAVLALMALGAAGLAVRAPRHAVVLCAPLAAAYLLAMLRLYPLATRVALWLVPIALILVCAGACTLVRLARLAGREVRDRRAASARRWSPRPGLVMPAAAATALLVTATPWSGTVPWWGTVPRGTNADRYVTAEQALRHVAEQRRPGELVLMDDSTFASALVDWYGPGLGLRPDGFYKTARTGRCRDTPLADASRVWLLRVVWRRAARKADVATMPRYGSLLSERWFGGVVVGLYDTSRPDRPSSTCLVIRSPDG